MEDKYFCGYCEGEFDTKEEKDCDHKYGLTLDWNCRCPGCGKPFGPLKVITKPSPGGSRLPPVVG